MIMETPQSWQNRMALGTVLALMAALAFACSNTAASVAFRGGSNPLTLAAARFVLPVIILPVWLATQGQSMWLTGRSGWIAAGLGVLTAVYSWALLNAIGAMPLALAILIFYLFPLVATVILALVGWENLGWKAIGAIVLAFVGLAFALDPRVSGLTIQGVLLGLLAAVVLGTLIAVSGRLLRAGDSRPVTLYMAFVAAVLLITLCALQGAFVLPTTTEGWIGFVAAAFCYAFAMITFFFAVSIIGPTRSSLLSYAEPVVAATLGVVLLKETLTATQISGIILVIVALVGATLPKRQPRPSSF